jgi:hypothetical protein
MRKIKNFMCVAFLSLILFPQIAKSQSKDSIEMRKSSFFQNGQVLKAAEVVNIMKPYPDAFNEMKSAKSQLDAANVFSFIGGGLFGWSVGGWIGGGDFNWGLAGAGAGLMVVSIPFYTSYSKKAGSAVELYNQSINNSSHRPVKWEIGFTGTGLACVLHF